MNPLRLIIGVAEPPTHTESTNCGHVKELLWLFSGPFRDKRVDNHFHRTVNQAADDIYR